MEELESQWSRLLDYFAKNITHGERPEIDGILFLIGVQELGSIKKRFSRDEKINLMHIAICKILEPFGYYKFSHRDEELWPHYKKIKDFDSTQNQEKIIKKAIIQYFVEQDLL